MRAQDLAAPFPTVGLSTSALAAARLLAGQNLPGLVAVAAKKQPLPGAITLDALLDRMLGE